MNVAVEVNGRRYEAEAEPRTLLSDFLRHTLGLTGTNVGCEHGVCGACSVQVDGAAVRSCLMLAVQAEGRAITTVEGLPWGPVHEAFREAHALQCGFCTPGFLVSVDAFLRGTPDPTDEEIREALAGNLCRCTGYLPIVDAVRRAARRLHPPSNKL